MKNLIEMFGEKPTISHRVVAENTANDEISIKKLIIKYKKDFQVFGVMAFQMTKPQNKVGGRPSKTYYLNEQQAYLLLTYLANTEIVRNFKVALVKAFFEMRSKLYPKHNGKSIPHQINGLKSGLALKDRKIKELESKLKIAKKLSSEELRVKNIKLIEENSEMKQAIAKIKMSLNIDDYSEDEKPFTHSHILELIYQFNAHRFELDETVKSISERSKNIDIFLTSLKNSFKRSSNYVDDVRKRGESKQLNLNLRYR